LSDLSIEAARLKAVNSTSPIYAIDVEEAKNIGALYAIHRIEQKQGVEVLRGKHAAMSAKRNGPSCGVIYGPENASVSRVGNPLPLLGESRHAATSAFANGGRLNQRGESTYAKDAGQYGEDTNGYCAQPVVALMGNMHPSADVNAVARNSLGFGRIARMNADIRLC
jgi:hypothetical protein